jgi:hypothetical protein
MRTLGIIALCVMLLIGGGFVWWHVKYPTYSYRYRLTLAIEADGKVHTGSSVIEILWEGSPPIGDVGTYHPRIRGQAVLVDLDKHGVVTTSLIAPSYAGRKKVDWPEGVDAIFLVPYAFSMNGGNEILPQLERLTGRRDLGPDNMPRLIWFSDLSDPKTARKISPGEISKVIGANAQMVGATVEITSDPIVIDINKKLPWYKALRGPPNNVIYLPDALALGWTMFVGDAS